MYANTTKESLDALEFVERQPTVSLDNCSNEASVCPICIIKYHHTEDPEHTLAERPIKLPCSHVIGADCGRVWLSPFENNKNNCPLCRAKVFSNHPRKQTLAALKARLEAFDSAWTMGKMPMTPAETELRARLWTHVRNRETSPGYVEPSEGEKDIAKLCALSEVWHFTSGHGTIHGLARQRNTSIRVGMTQGARSFLLDLQAKGRINLSNFTR